MDLSINDIDVFKKYCDENRIIPKLLKAELSEFFLEPILDVGSGLSDILTEAFPTKEVHHLDPLEHSHQLLPSAHKQIQGSFFEYAENTVQPYQTLFFSQVLQYLDDDVDLLNQRIHKLNPKIIITVMNTNQDLLGEVLRWAENHLPKGDPEIEVPNFAEGYALAKIVPFTAKVSCPDFQILAEQIAYLLGVTLTAETEALLVEFLKTKLEEPTFTIEQTIRVYRRA